MLVGGIGMLLMVIFFNNNLFCKLVTNELYLEGFMRLVYIFLLVFVLVSFCSEL